MMSEPNQENEKSLQSPNAQDKPATPPSEQPTEANQTNPKDNETYNMVVNWWNKYAETESMPADPRERIRWLAFDTALSALCLLDEEAEKNPEFAKTDTYKEVENELIDNRDIAAFICAEILRRPNTTMASNPSFWHMQLNPGESLGVDKVVSILTKISSIGLNFDEGSQQYNRFRHEMKVGDVVIVRDGQSPIALVQVVGEWEEWTGKMCVEELDWFPMRRQVKVLQYASESRLEDKFPKVMGTLERLVGDTPSRRYVEEWYNSLRVETGHDAEIQLLKANHQLILNGPPGTGKTYLARQLAAQLIGCHFNVVESSPRYRFVQFHSSYDYGDFVEGLKPELQDGQVHLKLKNGSFKEFCLLAKQEPEQSFVFVIDEINRADLSRVFGELFFAIESDYRGKDVATQYSYLSNERFAVPVNVFIIGTMNDIDRSVESIDFALRRRFAWLEMDADEALFDRIAGPVLGDLAGEARMRYLALNKSISEIPNLGKAYQIGPAYFRKLEKYADSPFDALWKFHLQVLIQEYLRSFPDAEEIEKQLKHAYFA